jgi:hypothetical protein
VEFLGGRAVIHRDAALLTATLTNSRYDESVGYLRSFNGFGGTRSMPVGSGSLERFARAAILMKQPVSGRTPPEQVFSILGRVAQENTRWSVVYEATRGEVSWKSRLAPGVRSLSLRELDFACGDVILSIDANARVAGDVRALLGEYTPDENLRQLLHAYASTSFLRNVPRDAIERAAAHAEAFSCTPRTRARGARR